MVDENHENILYKYSEIWYKIKEFNWKGLDVEVIHRIRYLITKTKSYNNN